MSTPPRDASARLAAASDLESNYVVTAGAGTGKTSLLVERILQLVFSGRTTLSRVVALTFTEKAAAEMKHRVAETLLLSSRRLAGIRASGGAALPQDTSDEGGRVLARLGGESLELLETRARAAVEELDGVTIGTIHGFCADLLRRHPREAGLPPDFAVDDTGSGAVPFEDAWPRFLAAELGPAGSRAALWTRVLDAFDLGQVRELAQAIHRSPTVEDLLSRNVPAARDPRDILGEEVRQLSQALRSELPAVPAARASFLEYAQSLLDFAGAFLEEGTEGLREAVTDSPLHDKIFRSDYVPTAGTAKTNPRHEEAKSAAKDLRRLVKELMTVREAAVRDLLEALRPYAAAARTRTLHDGIVSFDDLLLLARNLLRDHPECRRREAGRFDALLVDEFQDTDPLQYEIVFFLVADPEAPGTDPYALPLVPGRVFIVGDPKQSIYRFRGADMSAYDRAVRHVTAGGRPASLTINFRSRPEILDPVNRLFQGWIGEPPDRRIDPLYEAVLAHRSGGNGAPAAEIWSVATPGDPLAEARRRAEADVLAREIRSWIDGTAGAPGDADPPPRRARDIALLFRALSDVPLYTRALRRAGIDFVVEGGKAFAERPEVVEAFTLLRALANPGDPVCLLGVLRSAFGGVPDGELAGHAAADGTFQWNADPGGATSRIRAVLERLRELDALRQDLPLDRWITCVLTETEFLLGQAAYEDGSQRVANVRKLADSVAAAVRDRGLTLEEALLALEEVFTGERTEGESPLADEAIDAVRILSIHKAKGLEFPVVVLPDLARDSRGGRASTSVRVFEAASGPELAVRVEGRETAVNAIGLASDREEKRHEEAESKRVFYVAATRARDRLVLINSATRNLPPWVKALARLGYEAGTPFPPEGVLEGGLGHRVLAPVDSRGPRESRDAAGILEAHRRFREATEAAAHSAVPRLRNPSRDPRESLVARADTESAPALPDRDLARAAGIAVHRLLEGWDFRDPGRLRSRMPGAVTAASEETGADPERTREEVSRIVEGFLASPLPAELAGAEILGRELPILRLDPEGKVVHGYADLVYRLDGRIRVADYKTDARTDPAAARGYRHQIAEYARAVREALQLPEPPLCEVLFVRSGDRVVLEEEGEDP